MINSFHLILEILLLSFTATQNTPQQKHDTTTRKQDTVQHEIQLRSSGEERRPTAPLEMELDANPLQGLRRAGDWHSSGMKRSTKLIYSSAGKGAIDKFSK